MAHQPALHPTPPLGPLGLRYSLPCQLRLAPSHLPEDLYTYCPLPRDTRPSTLPT